jgi:prepilin-type processing-associated H-X9-DG protein
MLVVVTVIGVLIAMLLPALSQARAVSQSLLCLSNLRQQVVAAATYSNQNKGDLPPHSYNLFDHIMWYALIKDGALPAQYLNNRWGNSGQYWESSMLFCPGESVRTVLSTTTQINYMTLRSRNGFVTSQEVLSNACDSTYGTNGVRTHYGDNGAIPQNFRPARRSPWPFSTFYSQDAAGTFKPDGQLNRLEHLRSPADTFMTNDENRGARYQNCVFRHPKLTMNTSYADGHANGLTCGELDMNSSGNVSDNRLLVVH